MEKWTEEKIPSQAGRLAVVTGATGGIGYEAARAMAQAGADVIVAGRNPEKGKKAVARILLEAPKAKVRFERIDQASLQSVESFAGRLLGDGRAIDLLINNAGVMAPPKRQLSADGFELQFAVNHLSHFALTARLLSLLLRGRNPRVVNVASLAHRSGKVFFDDLQAERRYSPWERYCQSKLANLLFTRELQRRSDHGGWGLLADTAHPGYARTDLIANGPGEDSLLSRLSSLLLQPFLSQSAADGALPTLYAAVAPEAKPNGYYGPKGPFELFGAPAEARVAPKAKDDTAAERLWTVSEQLTGVAWPANGRG